MTKKLLLLSIITTVVLLSACEKEPGSGNNKATLAAKGVILNTDAAALSGRITLKNELMPVGDFENSLLKKTSAPPAVDLTKNYTFTLRAEVAPPEYEGNTLMATHVKIQDKYAFVTYNTKGDTYLGGLEVFDVSDISNPKIIWQAIFPKADVSAVDYYNNKLYIVGAMDNTIGTGSALRKPAFLEVLTMNSNHEISDVDTLLNLDSYAGTDIKVSSAGIFATSGSNGFLKVYNQAYDSVYAAAVTDARSVALNSSYAYVLGGQPGKVSVFNKSLPSYLTSYSPDGANTPESKSEMEANDKYIYTALNEGGLKVLNTDGSLKQYIARPLTPDGEDDADYVTNSVSLNGDLVLTANGEAGIYIGGIVADHNDSIFTLGAIKFGTNQSANFVESKDSIIFVATGLGGLKILSISIDEGVPDDIIPTKLCPTLVDDVLDLFPEGVNNFKAYPELFQETDNHNVILKKESEVYLTFADEIAGWKNSLGYYTYKVGEKPTSADQLVLHPLFENLSKVDDGGALLPGDMVRVGSGKFPANTVIGFYLIAGGWKNGFVTGGWYTHYTDYEFNLGGYQQHCLFINGSCNELVMTFEDISRTNTIGTTDSDFNDIILVVSDNKDPNHKTPSTAFDLTGIPTK